MIDMNVTDISLLIQASLYVICFAVGYICGKDKNKPKKSKKQLLKD